jgi:cell division protein FtsL
VFSILSLFLLVAFHVVAVQHAFELDRLAAQRADEERRYERLREQVATLSAPEAIVAAAEKLGMVPAERVNSVQAPPAAPRGERDDRTADTLGRAWAEAKRHLGADP